MSSLTIALDMMGGDHGPPFTIPAVVKAASLHQDIHFTLFGSKIQLEAEFEKLGAMELLAANSKLNLVDCNDHVGMQDKPSWVLRNRHDSSMRKMLEMVASGEAKACVSAGNTGALFTLAYYLIKTHQGIDRPALISALPTSDSKRVFLLDLGANVNCSAEILFQYAVMGSVLATQVAQITKPKVALLNVGEEDIKGNAQVKLADRLLRESKAVNYIGYIEGNGLFENRADVVVTDGFTGNIAIKSTQGLASFIIDEVKRYAQQDWFARMLVKFSLPVLRKIYHKVNPDQYNGASLIGLRGSVIKSHGNASSEAFYYAIQRAIQEAKLDVPNKIKASIESVMLEQV